MKEINKLDNFCKILPKYIGNGYKYFRITRIPSKKLLKKARILEKISHTYKTDLTSGKRQYRRKKGLANYAAFNYKDLIIVLKTAGTDETEGESREFGTFRRKMDLDISKHLKLVLYVDEREKLTYRIDKTVFKQIRANFERSFMNKNGKQFHILKNMFNNLPNYKGIGHQKRILIYDCREWKKEHRVKWDIQF